MVARTGQTVVYRNVLGAEVLLVVQIRNTMSAELVKGLVYAQTRLMPWLKSGVFTRTSREGILRRVHICEACSAEARRAVFEMATVARYTGHGTLDRSTDSAGTTIVSNVPMLLSVPLDAEKLLV